MSKFIKQLYRNIKTKKIRDAPTKVYEKVAYVNMPVADVDFKFNSDEKQNLVYVESSINFSFIQTYDSITYYSDPADFHQIVKSELIHQLTDEIYGEAITELYSIVSELASYDVDRRIIERMYKVIDSFVY